MRKDKRIKWIERSLTFDVTQKPRQDVFIIKFYFCEKKVGEIEIDGFELELRGWK